MKMFEIWIGFYSSGQGDHGGFEPKHLGNVEAIDFKTACMKYELVDKLRYIENRELNNEPLYDADYEWWFNHKGIFNSWVGPYYKSKELALKSFNK